MSTKETVFQKLEQLTGIKNHIVQQEMMVAIFKDYQEYCEEFMTRDAYLKAVGSINSYITYLATTGQAIV